MIDTTKLRMALGMSASLAELTSVMLNEQLLPPDHYEKPENLRVAMYRLRVHLKGYGVEVRSQRTLGYWLDDEDRQKLTRLCGGEADGVLHGGGGKVDIMEGYDGN